MKRAVLIASMVLATSAFAHGAKPAQPKGQNTPNTDLDPIRNIQKIEGQRATQRTNWEIYDRMQNKPDAGGSKGKSKGH